jgi:ADP-ribose pyrophosphatase
MNDDRLYEPILKRNTLYSGTYLALDRLEIQLPDKRSAQREVVRVNDAVAVLPIDSDGNAHLVRQNRPAIDRILMEIPAGVLDEGESPEQAAIRECEEEIGLKPGRLLQLLTYAHAEGYSTGMITLYVGLDLQPAGPAELDATEFLERTELPFEDLVRRVKCNEIQDSKTIISTLLWMRLSHDPDWLDF